MFALPSHPSAHDALSSHVLGRFAQEYFALQEAAAARLVAQARLAQDAGRAAGDEGWPDLAQRVRDAGEW